MEQSIIVALITGAVSLAGSIMTMAVSIQKNKQSNDLTRYRIEKLEEKVSKHNNLVERMYHLEQQEALAEQRIMDNEKEIDAMKRSVIK